MKILCVSLLRFGDLIQHLDLVRLVKQKYAEAEIHLLMNDSCQSIAPLVQEMQPVEKILFFPREHLQSLLAAASGSPVAAHLYLKKFSEDLRKANYDLSYNFTHNLLSTHFMQLTRTPTSPNARWSNYIDTGWASSESPKFQLLDAIARSQNLPFPSITAPCISGSVHDEPSVTLGIQFLTSDERKNWGLENFLRLARLLLEQHSDLRIRGYGSPQEQEEITSAFGALVEQYGNRFQLSFPKWAKLGADLAQCDFLLSGDTSVLHLAAQMQIPSLSFYFIPGHAQKFSPRIVGARVFCANSAHDLSVESVMSALGETLQIEKRNSKEASLYQVQSSPQGYLRLVRSGDEIEHETENLITALEQEVWQFWLDDRLAENVPPFATAAKTFLQMSKCGPSDRIRLQEALNTRQIQNEKLQILIEELKSSVAKASRIFASPAPSESFASEFQRWRVALMNATAHVDYLAQLRHLMQNSQLDFRSVKQIFEAANEVEQLLKIESKMIRTAINEITEMSERSRVYVAGTRKLSATRPEASR